MANGGRGVHPNALPNYQQAEIMREKLYKYALNPTHEADHPSGSHGLNKARVFKSALGFDQSNWEVLKQRILDELPYPEAFLKEESQWGRLYQVDLAVWGVNNNFAAIRTIWIIRPGTEHPSLVTLWVLPERGD